MAHLTIIVIKDYFVGSYTFCICKKKNYNKFSSPTKRSINVLFHLVIVRKLHHHPCMKHVTTAFTLKKNVIIDRIGGVLNIIGMVILNYQQRKTIKIRCKL